MNTEEIKPGDRVRSYDFEFRRDCYVEGVVVEITEPIEGCPRYKIRVERLIWDGEVQPLVGTTYAVPPVNGTPTLLGRVTNGVEKL